VTDPSAPLRALERFILEQIPLARAIDRRVAAHDGDMLALDAPLAPNVNDKGCAFGGSLTSVMTLAGWALVELALQARGIHCDVYVGATEVRYLTPVWSDFRAEARLDAEAGADWERFFTTLAERGKARVDVLCSVHERDNATVAATLRARFIAKCAAATP
jgi:thioesterase domain-containing protein